MKKVANKPIISAPKPLPKAQPYVKPVRTQQVKVEEAIEWNSKLAKSEYTQRRMTFGAYTNVQIKDIPDSYIKWGILNLNTEWATMFARELQRREPKWGKI